MLRRRVQAPAASGHVRVPWSTAEFGSIQADRTTAHARFDHVRNFALDPLIAGAFARRQHRCNVQPAPYPASARAPAPGFDSYVSSARASGPKCCFCALLAWVRLARPVQSVRWPIPPDLGQADHQRHWHRLRASACGLCGFTLRAPFRLFFLHARAQAWTAPLAPRPSKRHQPSIDQNQARPAENAKSVSVRPG